MDYLLNRLTEASTWRGIVAIITACGVTISPEQIEVIVAGGLALMGIMGAFFPDLTKGAKPDEKVNSASNPPAVPGA